MQLGSGQLSASFSHGIFFVVTFSFTMKDILSRCQANQFVNDKIYFIHRIKPAERKADGNPVFFATERMDNMRASTPALLQNRLFFQLMEKKRSPLYINFQLTHRH